MIGRDANLYAYTWNAPIDFVDPFGLDVVIRTYCCHAPNLYGHVGIAINDNPSSGFYPNQESWRVAANMPVPGQLVPDSEKWKPNQVEDAVRIPTTPDQDRKIQTYLDQVRRSPGQYQLHGRNCSNVVQEALRVGGIDLGPLTSYPRDVMRQIQRYLATVAPF
jgi:hypothetical protein